MQLDGAAGLQAMHAERTGVNLQALSVSSSASWKVTAGRVLDECAPAVLVDPQAVDAPLDPAATPTPVRESCCSPAGRLLDIICVP